MDLLFCKEERCDEFKVHMPNVTIGTTCLEGEDIELYMTCHEEMHGFGIENSEKMSILFKVDDMEKGWDFVMLNLDPEMWVKDLHQQWTAKMGGQGSVIFDVVGLNETAVWENFHTKSVTVGSLISSMKAGMHMRVRVLRDG